MYAAAIFFSLSKATGWFLTSRWFLHGVKRQSPVAQLIYTTVLEALETDHHRPLEDSALWALSFKIASLPALKSVKIICELPASWSNPAVTCYRGVTAVGATFRQFPSFIPSNSQPSLTSKVRFCLQPIYWAQISIIIFYYIFFLIDIFVDTLSANPGRPVHHPLKYREPHLCWQNKGYNTRIGIIGIIYVLWYTISICFK